MRCATCWRAWVSASRLSDDADPLLTIAIPPHRSDVSRPEDIIEEVARIIGYETIPTTLLTGTIPHVIREDRWIAREAARDAVANAGLIEVMAYSFTNLDALDRLATAGGPRGGGCTARAPRQSDG